MSGYSDWEYYSDDFYDDDPSLLRNNPDEGSTLQRGCSKRSSGLHRGKKRKRGTTSDIPELSLDQDSQNSPTAGRPWFKGTVWRSSSPKNKKKLYEPGMGERVALLGNWREVFRASQPFGNSRTKSPLRSQRSGGKSTPMTSKSTSKEPNLPHHMKLQGSSEGLELEDDDSAALRDRKRRRVSFAKGPHSPPKHRIVVEIPVHPANGVGKDRQEQTKGRAHGPPSNRKRKANDAESGTANEEVSKHRAKRVASGKTPLIAKQKDKPPPLPAARITRSRKI